MYIWQHNEWPRFRYQLPGLEDLLYLFAERVGRVSGAWHALAEPNRQEAMLQIMSAEAVKSSEIEGLQLNRGDVYSSIQKNLGLALDEKHIGDRRAAGAAELMVAVRQSWDRPLTADALCDWQYRLLAGSSGIQIGSWRESLEPMRIVSGPLGRETVHFEAPPASRVPGEMQQFLQWFNNTAPGGSMSRLETPVRSALAHLYFETIHPFEDGNGRIGRAVAEKALSQGVGRPVLLSLSGALESDRRAYYAALGHAQRNLEVTEWLRYFLQVILKAQTMSEQLIDFALKKIRFFERFEQRLNNRQLKVVRRMLQEGPEGFVGGMSARKYVGIAGTSKATATRDLQELRDMGAIGIRGSAGGRSTSYDIRL
ncbi:Fic family protein [Spirochaeta africana]|uniref:Fido domain-containing protein n=1 Tax=Spirochaeta africana (strain ATCC 700263 / DSM 8902 / Z-7692) TaxID=889378 RepID=H9UF57_SPIAZ|nr:Fic family protein [Spirochaeta africana]AFG36150.1 hypothetical protein Spiaf_0041 [Spirochaeta africana DSM 8902]